MPIMTIDEAFDYIADRKGPPEKAAKFAAALLSGEPHPLDDPRYTGNETFDPFQGSTMGESFLYYFGRGTGNTVRTLVYNIRGSELPKPEDIDSRILDARRGAGDFGAQPDIDAIEWRGPCYLIFYFDFEDWVYLKTKEGTMAALYFQEHRGSKRHGNYCFYNARSLPVSVSKGMTECLVVENHHLKAPEPGYGVHEPRKQGHPEDLYKFDIYLGQPIENVPNKMLWHVIDPAGRNLGPP